VCVLFIGFNAYFLRFLFVGKVLSILFTLGIISIYHSNSVIFNSDSMRQVADTCECGNEPSGSVKCGEFLD